MVRLRKLIDYFEEIIPLSLSLPPDKNGLKYGSLDKNIKKILCVLELTNEVVEFAITNKIDCIFTHHDPFYLGIDYLVLDNIHSNNICKLIKNDICLYCAHTNLDVVREGLNDYLFMMLGGKESKILDNKTRIGRFGSLTTPLSLEQYVKKYVFPLKAKEEIRVLGKGDRIIDKICVVNGKGNSFINSVIKNNIDLYITGDIGYHDAILAKNNDLCLIDIGHDVEYVVQSVFNKILNTIKKHNKLDFTLVKAKFDFNPFKLV